MELKNKTRYGLVVWGTKQGMDIFFTININADIAELRLARVMADVRMELDFTRSEIGEDFYSIEHQPGYSLLSQYRTVKDWIGKGRAGFYGISLVVPADKTFLANNVQAVLNRISQLYWDHYVMGQQVGNGQIEDVAEDQELFEAIIGEEANGLKRDPVRPIRGNNKGFVSYSDPFEVGEIFGRYRLGELMEYERVYLLSSSGGVSPLTTVRRVVLDVPPSDFEVSIAVIDGETDGPVSGFEYNFLKNGQQIEKRVCAADQFTLAENILPKDKVRIVLTKEGYDPTHVTRDDLFPHGDPGPGAARTIYYTVRLFSKVVVEVPMERKIEIRKAPEPKEVRPERSTVSPGAGAKVIEFIRKNGQYVMLAGGFFGVIGVASLIFLNSGHVSGKFKDSTTVVPAKTSPVENFEADSTAIEDAYGLYLNSKAYLESKSADKPLYVNAQTQLLGIQKKLNAYKNLGSDVTAAEALYAERMKELDSIFNKRKPKTNADPDPPKKEKEKEKPKALMPPQGSREDILVNLNAGRDATTLAQKQKYLGIAMSKGANRTQDQEVLSKLDQLINQISNLKKGKAGTQH